jgi:putative transposase
MIELLEVGNFVVKEDSQYKIKRISGSKITLVDTFTDNEIVQNISDLKDQIFIGKAKITFANKAKQALQGDSSMDFSSYPKKQKEKALDKWKYVSRYRTSDISGFSEKLLKDFLAETEKETGVKAPSWRTLKRWYEIAEENGIRGLIDKHHLKGNTTSRVGGTEENMILQSLDKLKDAEKITFKFAHQIFDDSVIIHNAENPQDQLSSISYQAFVNKAKKIAPYDLLVGHIGKSKADKLYKQNKRNKPVKYILDRAEIDHTRLDLFVVDDVMRLPLGRPNITSVLDVKSKSILGFYVGFEVPSFVSVAKAVKHAISDKTDYLKRFPKLRNKWLCKGVFHEIAYDRGREFDSNLLEEALLDLDVVGRGNPAAKAWYKGSIESHFNTINKRFLVNKPGKVFSDLTDSNEYNSEKNGVISFSALMEMLVIWVVDEYQVSANSNFTAIPNLTWRQDLPYVDVTPINPDKLDIVFSENTTRTNNDKGIGYLYLHYDNDRLTKMRRRFGYRLEQIKINREDMSYIYVLDPNERVYFKVEAIDQEYTKGLGLYQHKRILKFHKKFIKGQVDELGLALARKRIEEIIDREVLADKRSKTGTIANVARFKGIGQDMEGPATVVNSGNANNLPPLEEAPKGDNAEFLDSVDDDIEDDLDDELE